MTTTSPEPTPSTRRARERDVVGQVADRYIRKLQHGYREDRPAAVSALARLRRGAGHRALDVPDLWGLIGADELGDVLAEASDEQRRAFDPDRAEEALHLAVTLWALHQQSHHEVDLHVYGRGLGQAVRALMTPASGKAEPGPENPAATGRSATARAPEANEPLRLRFVRVGTAGSLDILAQRLREIVLLLRRETIPLDYGLLADQLYRWQDLARTAAVRREWGRDFHLAGLTRGKRADQSA